MSLWDIKENQVIEFAIVIYLSRYFEWFLPFQNDMKIDANFLCQLLITNLRGQALNWHGVLN